MLAKACICHDLGGGATGPRGIDPEAHTAVCCGPNAAYFQRRATLREMVDHIYERTALPLHPQRPHMFIKELMVHVARMRAEISGRDGEPSAAGIQSLAECCANLLAGVRHYRELVRELAAGQRESFSAALATLQAEIEQLVPVPVERD